MKKNRAVALGVISFCLFILASIYITYPLIFHITDRVTGFGDELVIAWIQNWVIHALTTNPLSLFEANLYYPYHNTLAFTETFTLTSVLAIPIRFFTGEPISTVNFTFISSLVLLGFSVYLLCFYLTKNFFISLFSGFLMIFSPAVLDYSVHLHILSLECVLLSILFLLHFIKTQKHKFLVLSLCFFVLQIYNSIMPGYFILFAYIIIFLFNLMSNKKRTLKLISIKSALMFVSFFLLVIPIAIPYFSVSNQFHYTRDIRDAVHLALQPEDYLFPGNRTRLEGLLMNVVPTNHPSHFAETKPGFLGVIFTFIVIFVVIYIVKNFKKLDLYIKTFFTLSLFGLIMSFGPVLHLNRYTVHKPFLIPLPYMIFYFIIPGFQGFRNSARWNMLFILCITIVIVLVLNKILKRFSFGKQFVIYLILFLGVVIELSPLKLFPVVQKKDFPTVYHWLATTRTDSKVIELPIYNWNMEPYTRYEIYREYYGTINFRKTINGYTGFSPPPWQDLVYETILNFPSSNNVDKLRKLGVTYIIVHKKEYDLLNHDKFMVKGKTIKDGSEILAEIASNKHLKLIKKFSDDYVFKFVD